MHATTTTTTTLLTLALEKNAAKRWPGFVFSLTSISGETDGGDSPFVNIPAEEEASVQKTTRKGFI